MPSISKVTGYNNSKKKPPKKLQKAAMDDGALSLKTKELIALAIGIARQCSDCIGFHTQAAVKAGASKEEIAETVTVSMLMGGGPAYMYGARALEAYDQFTGEAEARRRA